MRTRLQRFAAVACLGLGISAAGATVAFGDGASPDAQLQELTVELKKLDVADRDHVATQEIGKAEALRDKARSLVGNRKAAQELRWTLEELEATVALIDAKIGKHKADKELASVKQALEAKRNQIAVTNGEAQKLEEKQSELEKKLEGKKGGGQ